MLVTVNPIKKYQLYNADTIPINTPIALEKPLTIVSSTLIMIIVISIVIVYFFNLQFHALLIHLNYS